MKKRTKEILDILDQQFGTEYKCYLNYETPWQLQVHHAERAKCLMWGQYRDKRSVSEVHITGRHCGSGFKRTGRRYPAYRILP